MLLGGGLRSPSAFLVIIIVTGRSWENRLNWIPDPAPATSRDHGIKLPEGPKEEKENHPPCISSPQDTQEDATQAEKADTAEASSSMDQ